MTLDIRTLVIMSAVTPFGIGVLMTIYLTQRKVYPGFSSWVLANFFFSIGYLGLSLRDSANPFISVVLSNILIVLSEVLIFEGIRRFYNKIAFSIFNYLLLGCYVFAQIYFTYVYDNINARVILVCIVLFVLIIRSGIELMNCPFPELKKTANGAASLFFITALTPGLRGIYTAVQTTQVNLIADAMGAWASMIILASVIIWTFYFFFLTSARIEMELKQAHAEMSLFAATDFLTGLYNRRYFLEHGANEFDRAKRENKTFSIFFIDLDNLKQINDRFGHEAGDNALIYIAEILKSETRSYDVAARFGGDEFILLLCNTDLEKARQVAERIRFTAEKIIISDKDHPLHVRISMGVTVLKQEDININQLLQRADTALYQAKNEGKNRVVFA